MPDRTAASALESARKIKDHDKRAAYLGRQLSKVDKPAKLVEAWLDALHDGSPTTTEIGELALEVAKKFPKQAAFLTQLGCGLDDHYRETEAIEVLRLALAVRGRSRELFETLGRLLVLRGDASGVEYLERAIEAAPAWRKPRVALASYLVEREPERAMELIELINSGRAHELRAMCHAAGGSTQAAARAEASAVASYANEVEGRKELSEWHFAEGRYARARVHAAALLAMRRELPERELAAQHDLDELDEAIVQAYRLGGGFAELVPWLRERCRDGVPSKLAWDIFYGLTGHHPCPDVDLAVRAAEVRMKSESKDKQSWRVRIAGLRAEEQGDLAALEALARDGLDDNASAWVELADRYRAVDQLAAAHASVDRALQLDPDNAGALDTMYTLALDSGDLAALEKIARALLVAKPLWHQGPEHLGRYFTRRADPQGLPLARRALELAPYCQNAWMGLGEALVVAGDLDAARDAAARSRSIEAPKPGDDISVLSAAVSGDAEALERALAERYRHLPALPFPDFIAKLRAAARR